VDNGHIENGAADMTTKHKVHTTKDGAFQSERKARTLSPEDRASEKPTYWENDEPREMHDVRDYRSD
jgi:hypothetical protein